MKIRIYRQHTHAGQTFPAFSVIDLPDEDAKRVIDMEGAMREETVKAKKQAPVTAAPVAEAPTAE